MTGYRSSDLSRIVHDPLYVSAACRNCRWTLGHSTKPAATRKARIHANDAQHVVRLTIVHWQTVTPIGAE